VLRVSAEFRRFLAQLAIDPEAYGRYLADPVEVARAARLTDAQVAALTGGNQNTLYAALISDLVDNGEDS
jgi:hypothetical protein